VRFLLIGVSLPAALSLRRIREGISLKKMAAEGEITEKVYEKVGDRVLI